MFVTSTIFFGNQNVLLGKDILIFCLSHAESSEKKLQRGMAVVVFFISEQPLNHCWRYSSKQRKRNAIHLTTTVKSRVQRWNCAGCVLWPNCDSAEKERAQMLSGKLRQPWSSHCDSGGNCFKRGNPSRSIRPQASSAERDWVMKDFIITSPRSELLSECHCVTKVVRQLILLLKECVHPEKIVFEKPLCGRLPSANHEQRGNSFKLLQHETSRSVLKA